MSEFNHLDYDIYHLGVSTGKDSVAAFLWLLYESNWPLDRVMVTFCDTGNEDYYTYRFLDYLKTVHPIMTIQPEMDFWELAKFKKRFPSRKARFCTQWLKIIPTRDYILNLMRNGANILLLTGVRREEGKAHNNRGNLPVFGWDDGLACDVYRPIYEQSKNDVFEIAKHYLDLEPVLQMVRDDPYLDNASFRWEEIYQVKVDFKSDLLTKITNHGIPRNPLYDLGASRVGCFPCINSAKPELRSMDKYRPQRTEFLAKKELETGNEKNNGYSSFFSYKSVPKIHRSKEIVTSKDKKIEVATIYDVVEWAKTARGGNQFDFDPEILAGDELPACGIHGECE